MSHTPGPWKIITPKDRGAVDDDSYGIAGPRTGNPSRSVCFADVEGETPEEAAANAALICAAPELLEACRVALSNLDENEYPHVAKDLRAAIAKAEGRT